jgi:hypothetical protein
MMISAFPAGAECPLLSAMHRSLPPFLPSSLPPFLPSSLPPFLPSSLLPSPFSLSILHLALAPRVTESLHHQDRQLCILRPASCIIPAGRTQIDSDRDATLRLPRRRRRRRHRPVGVCVGVRWPRQTWCQATVLCSLFL